MTTRAGVKRINLALQGGGAHGALTWGVLDRLLEDERIEIEAISGASAGAVNATALAYGIHLGGREGARRKLDELWEEVAHYGALMKPFKAPLDFVFGEGGEPFSYQMFENFTRLFSPYQYNPFDINPLRDLLDRLIDFDRLKSCKKTTLFLSATNVRSGKVHVFNTAEVDARAVCASACLPFLFKAVEINGERYWDGGYMGNPVLFPFFYGTKTDDVLIVHVNPIEREKLPVTASEIFDRINEISFNSSLLRELRAVAFINKLLDEGWIKDARKDELRNIRVHSLRADKFVEDLGVASKFKVDRAFLETLKERGRALAESWLADHFHLIGVKSSVDIRQMFESN